jgi:hypothetical protein
LTVSDVFGVENDGRCRWDYVQVTAAGTLQGKYCGEGTGFAGQQFLLQGPVVVEWESFEKKKTVLFKQQIRKTENEIRRRRKQHWLLN